MTGATPTRAGADRRVLTTYVVDPATSRRMAPVTATTHT